MRLFRVQLAWMVAALSLLMSCRGTPAPPPRDQEAPAVPMTYEQVVAVQERHTAELMAVPGVTGVAVGKLPDGRYCISVLVLELDEATKKRLPRALESVPVQLVESGEIKPMRRK